MLNQRLSAAKTVAAELFPAEADLENAIVRTARLTIALVEGRRTAKLPITTCQDELDHLVSVSAHLAEARKGLAAAHVALRRTQHDIGLRAVSFGDLWECPKTAIAPQEAANVA